MKRTARVAALAVLGSFVLAGCGGGGGGSSTGGSGGVTPGGGTTVEPSLTVSPSRIDLTASANTSSRPTAVLNLTLKNPPSTEVYVGAGTQGNVIEDLSFSTFSTQGTLMVTFKDPSTLSPGTYTDSVMIALCVDSGCAQVKQGTEHVIPVTYTINVTSTVTLTATPATTGPGLPVTLTWTSTNADSCTASGAWSGTMPSSGSTVVVPATVGTHTYTLACSNPGAVGQSSVTVTAVGPTASLAVFPKQVTLGKPVTLRWSSENAAGCTASGAWSGSLAAKGWKTVTPTGVGVSNYHVDCSNSAAAATADTSATVVAAPLLAPATAYRINERHDGVLQTGGGLVGRPSTSAPTWTRDLGGPVSYPLVVNGRVYVTTANPDGSYGNRLFALDAHTGAVLWGPIAIAGTYYGDGLTYDAGRVFVLMSDGDIHAFDALTGAPAWTTRSPFTWFGAPPTAYGGFVFTSAGGGLSAVDATTGVIAWTSTDGGVTDWGSPAVTSEGVYLQNSSCLATMLEPLAGTRMWQVRDPCAGGWSYTPVVRDGLFFGRSGSALELRDAYTGSRSVQLGSERAPAITSTAVIALNAGTLSSTRLSDRVQAWTFAGDGSLVTAPLVVNDTVFVGSSTGKVFGLDAATGAEVWTGVSPVALGPDSENGGPRPPAGPTAGEDVLVYPAGNTVVSWRLQ